MINIIIQRKINLKIIILTMRSKDLEVCAKKSSDLYFKTEGVEHKQKNINIYQIHNI